MSRRSPARGYRRDGLRGLLAGVRRGAVVVEALQPQDYVRLGELPIAYADLRLRFVDATVLAVT